MTPKASIRYGLMALLALTLVGCQATKRGLNFDTSATINLSAEADVNPDMDGRASPVVIRVFKLTDARQFRREDFLNLYENAEQRLGNDLLDVVILKELVPGESRQEFIELTPDTRYLGFMAEYMQYQKAAPIIVVPIKDHNRNKVEVIAQALRLIDPAQPQTFRGTSNRYEEARETVSKANDERRYWEQQRKALKD
ncbi:MAG: type VI secretion system lipoprotein TssJ [Cellvibrionaceae bacterium]